MSMITHDNPGVQAAVAKPGSCCSSNNNKAKVAQAEDIAQVVDQLAAVLPRLKALATE